MTRQRSGSKILTSSWTWSRASLNKLVEGSGVGSRVRDDRGAKDGLQCVDAKFGRDGGHKPVGIGFVLGVDFKVVDRSSERRKEEERNNKRKQSLYIQAHQAHCGLISEVGLMPVTARPAGSNRVDNYVAR